MFNITLTDGYFVEVEGVDHVLKQHTTTKKDKEVIKNIGYFSSFTQAFNRYLKEIQSEEADGLVLDIEEYINTITAINKKAVEDILKIVGDNYGTT